MEETERDRARDARERGEKQNDPPAPAEVPSLGPGAARVLRAPIDDAQRCPFRGRVFSGPAPFRAQSDRRFTGALWRGAGTAASLRRRPWATWRSEVRPAPTKASPRPRNGADAPSAKSRERCLATRIPRVLTRSKPPWLLHRLHLWTANKQTTTTAAATATTRATKTNTAARRFAKPHEHERNRYERAVNRGSSHALFNLANIKRREVVAKVGKN